MKHVIIIDDNVEWCAALSYQVNRHSEYSVVATAADGREGVLLIEYHRPDLVILDIIMPDDDGVKVIKHIREKCDHYNPVLYVITAVNSHAMMDMLNGLGIDFIDTKPVYNDQISNRLNQISTYALQEKKSFSARVRKRDIADIVQDLLQELNVPLRFAGYRYIKTAVYYLLDNPDIKPDIYDKICITCHCTKASADKNIRTAVETSMRSDLYIKLFGTKRVSNLTFIHTVVLVVDKRLRGSDIE